MDINEDETKVLAMRTLDMRIHGCHVPSLVQKNAKALIEVAERLILCQVMYVYRNSK